MCAVENRLSQELEKTDPATVSRYADLLECVVCGVWQSDRFLFSRLS